MKYLLIVLGALSIFTFLLYGIDKLKAKLGAWRITEKVLLGFAVLGGGLGAILGMNLFRHKTKHWYFWVVGIFGIIVQVALIVLVYTFLDKSVSCV